MLDLVLLAADMEDLSYDPVGCRRSGYILEARRDPRRGIEVSVIVKNGTLRSRRSDPDAERERESEDIGRFFGKDSGQLEPSAPAVIIGLKSFPRLAKDSTVGTSGERKAGSGEENEKIWKSTGECRERERIETYLKASDAGSLEALAVVLEGIGKKDEKGIAIVDESVGDITDSDVKNALATGRHDHRV